VSLKNFQDILEMPKEPRRRTRCRVPDLRRLEFEHVTSSTSRPRAPALTDISFDGERGDTLAFVGPSAPARRRW
jgi:ATP-binding cassette subfamily B protein